MAISRTDLATISHTLFRFFGSHSSIASGDADRFLRRLFRDSRLMAVKSLALHHKCNYCCNRSCLALQWQKTLFSCAHWIYVEVQFFNPAMIR